MPEEIMKNIYRIEVTLPDSPLKSLNSYFIRGKDRDLLIDTGFRCETCRAALKKGLEEIGADIRRTDVLITHMHADHSGLMREFAAPDGRIYMSTADLNVFRDFKSGANKDLRRERYLSEGFPEAVLSEVEKRGPQGNMASDRVDERLTAVSEGDIVKAGDYSLEVVAVPGHTPGNLMLWMEEQKTMFTGDHILFDITPNITCWPKEKDSLGNYLQSLQKSKKYPVLRAFPGHRKEGDYSARIEELLHHHGERLREVSGIVSAHPGLCGYEAAGFMQWKIRADSWESFPVVQKGFAVGECLAHLDYLTVRNKISVAEENGIRRYYPNAG